MSESLTIHRQIIVKGKGKDFVPGADAYLGRTRMNRQKIADSQRRWLSAALSEWQADSLLSTDQADQILARYETNEELGLRKQSLVMFTLLGMAALLFGLAVLLVIGFNWEATPRSREKLAIILACICTDAGLHLAGSGQGPKASGGGVLPSAVCSTEPASGSSCRCSISRPTIPMEFGGGPLGYCHLLFALTRFYVTYCLSCLMALWAGMEVLGFVYLSPWFLFGWWQWPNGAYSLPLLRCLDYCGRIARDRPWR